MRPGVRPPADLTYECQPEATREGSLRLVKSLSDLETGVKGVILHPFHAPGDSAANLSPGFGHHFLGHRRRVGWNRNRILYALCVPTREYDRHWNPLHDGCPDHQPVALHQPIEGQ